MTDADRYYAVPENEQNEYNIQITGLIVGEATFEQVSGTTITGTWDGSTLNINIKETTDSTHRGVVPFTVFVHDNDTVEWINVHLMIVGPLVDSIVRS